MTLVDLYRNAYSLAKNYHANSSDLAILFVLIGEWNEQRRPESTFISKQALQNLSSLPETTVRRSLQKLLSWRIIGTERLNGQVVIKIRPQAEWRIHCEKTANERRTQDVCPITRARACANSSEETREECACEEEPVQGTAADYLMNRRRNRDKT